MDQVILNVENVTENVPEIVQKVTKTKKVLTPEELAQREQERKDKARETAKKYYHKKKDDPEFKRKMIERAKEYQNRGDIKPKLKAYRKEYYKGYRKTKDQKIKELQDQLEAIKKLLIK